MNFLIETLKNLVKVIVVIAFIAITVNFVKIDGINIDITLAPLVKITTTNNHYYQNSIIHQIVEK